MPPKKVAKEKVARCKESEAGVEMAVEEGAEPSVLGAEAGVAPSTSAPAPQPPPSAPAASTGQAPNIVDTAKAAAMTRALQTRAEILSTSEVVVPQAASPQQATTSTALTAAQVNTNLEAQAEADMGAMRQNMARL
jgi:hypothetical protein